MTRCMSKHITNCGGIRHETCVQVCKNETFRLTDRCGKTLVMVMSRSGEIHCDLVFVRVVVVFSLEETHSIGRVLILADYI